MDNQIILENKKRKCPQITSEGLYKGACVKIINSQKTFQVIGINLENNMCWVREWPFTYDASKTFALEISKITLQIFCTN